MGGSERGRWGVEERNEKAIALMLFKQIKTILRYTHRKRKRKRQMEEEGGRPKNNLPNKFT